MFDVHPLLIPYYFPRRGPAAHNRQLSRWIHVVNPWGAICATKPTYTVKTLARFIFIAPSWTMNRNEIWKSETVTTYADPLPDRRAQLDGLRIIAMTGVLLVHFWVRDPLIEHVRVSLFFTVSGFIITLILLKARDRAKRTVVVNFYIRRALRLLPPLAVLLGVSIAFDLDGARSSAWWHVFQASNIYFSLNETWSPWVFAHLWSLNVLEQFYVIWPIVILLLSPRLRWIVVGALVVLPMLLRGLVEDRWLFLLPMFAFDPIALGALLALARDHRLVRAVLANDAALAVAMIVILSPLLVAEVWGHSETYRVASNLSLVAIVAGAYHGYSGIIGRVLGHRSLEGLSQISYGAYVYHLMVWYFAVEMWPVLYLPGPITFALMTCATLICAVVSWHVIEKPISRLKTRFPIHNG